MTKAAAKPKAADPVPITGAAVLEQFTGLMARIPEAPEGDIADILGPILRATSWEDLQETEGLPSSKDLVGRKLRCDRVMRRPSDHESVTGQYLICTGANIDTGEVLRWSVGGEQALAVHAQLHALNAYPAYVEYRSVGTRSGYEAINAVVLGVVPRDTIDG